MTPTSSLIFAGGLLAVSVVAASADPLTLTVPADDGTPLATWVHLPEGSGPFPAIVVRSPYGLPTQPPGPVVVDDEATDAEILATWAPVLARGHAVVMQNTRGRAASGGLDQLFAADRADGAALARWVVEQDWSDGTFRVAGDSADGFAGHLLVAENPPGLRGAFFQASCGDLQQQGVVRRTGGLQVEVLAPWIALQAAESGAENQAAIAARAADPEALEDAAKALVGAVASGDAGAALGWPLAALDPLPTLQPAWTAFIGEAGYAERAAAFDAVSDAAAPVVHVGLWGDAFLDCTISGFERMQARVGGQSLVVLNGTHYDIDEPATWEGADTAFLDWLDGAPQPAVRFAVEGADDPREVHVADAWPPEGAEEMRLAVTAAGLGTDAAGGTGPIGQVVTDPADPVATAGGRNLVLDAGPAPQDLAPRDGRVVLMASPAEADRVIVGPVTLTAMVAADAADADVVAKLAVVDADGAARLVVETLWRARYRDGREAPARLVPGAVTPMVIELGQTAHLLRAGERLALILEGSNRPRWDMTAGTDEDPSLATEGRRVTTSVLGTPDVPATLVLRTIDPALLRPAG